MKTKTLLIAAVMFLGLSAAAFAQATYSVGSIPVTAVVNTGLVEKTGDITFTQVSGAALTGTITVSYGVQITNDTTTGIGVKVIAGSVNPPVINKVDNAGGQVVINVNPLPATPTTDVTVFALVGVRVAVAGTTLSNLTANISTTQNAITAGQTSVVVISSIAPGIASIKTTTAGTINSNTLSATSPVITVKEGFLNAWGSPADLTAAGLRITLSTAPPAGVKITFPASAATDSTGVFQTMASDGTAVGTTGAVTISSSSTSLAVYYKVVSATDPTVQETLTIPVTLDVSGAEAPLPVVTITYVVSMAPIGTAFDADGNVIDTVALIPRYVASDVGPATLLTVTTSTTTLLVPFAQTVTSAGYNTGFAVSNTTSDPGKTATGFASPIAQSGTITFYFFPQVSGGTAPATFSYTTSASSPGTGLDASGKVPSGSTYTVLLSQILAAANAPADFTGYCFIVTNFTNAHGQYVLSNFTTFSQGALALVLPGLDRTNVPEALNN